MSSRFILKSRINNHTPMRYEWSSFITNSAEHEEEQRKHEEERSRLALEKERIESIPLEQLSFKDLYEFPFHQPRYNSWVYDKNGNFIFQFEIDDKKSTEIAIQILNGELEEYKRQVIEFKDGQIFINNHLFITIRGWGNLTGGGAYNLNGEHASKIQDTLAEYIVEKIKL